MAKRPCQRCGESNSPENITITGTVCGITRKSTYTCDSCGATGYSKNNTRAGQLAKKGDYFDN